MALPPLELPPIEKGRPVAGRPFCLVEKMGPNEGDERRAGSGLEAGWGVVRGLMEEGGRGVAGADFADGLIADRMAEEQADVAQLVEQLIRNQQVNGSSPFVGSIHFG